LSKQFHGTLEAAGFCAKAGFDFHLIDAEWQENYMAGSDLDRLLTVSGELDPDLTTVVAINARHSRAFEIAEEYTEVMSQHGNGGLCFVAGNSAYLSEEERTLSAAVRIRQLVETNRTKLPLAEIFVGSEGVANLASELAADYSAIPFMLLNGNIQTRVSRYRSKVPCGEIAVYCPCYLLEADNEALIRTLGLYALRRGRVKEMLRECGFAVSDVKPMISDGQSLQPSATGILAKAIRELALCGASGLQNTVNRFAPMKINYLAVLPAQQTEEHNKKLSEAVSELRKT
jgi:hypothetical protein